jgi:tetratricopeptide (TPR) repeat protein
MLANSTNGTILIFGYSCSDKFDISPALRTATDVRCQVLYLNHTDDRANPRIQNLSDSCPSEHPLARLGARELSCCADDLIEVLWSAISKEPPPVLEQPSVEWVSDVEAWIREVGDNGNGFLTFLSGLLQKAANNWERSNELLLKALGQELNDTLRVRSYLALGNNCRDAGQLPRALDYLNEAHKRATDLVLEQDEARALNSLGIVAADQHNYDLAIDLYEGAIKKAKQTGDQELEGKCHGNIGILLKNRNRLTDLTEALVHHAQALRISRDIGDKRSEGRTLGNFGIAFSDLGYKQAAQGFYGEARQIASELGDSLHVGIWLHNAGEDALGFDRLLGAQLLQDAMSVFRELGKEDFAAESERVLMVNSRPPSP